jgi:hypothetical protein
MKNLTLLFISLCFIAFSCKKDSKSNNSDCVNQYLLENGFTNYTNQDLDCECITALWKLDGQDYFVYDSPCCDMLPVPPVNCDGINYCDATDAAAFAYFFNNAVSFGIIGFK